MFDHFGLACASMLTFYNQHQTGEADGNLKMCPHGGTILKVRGFKSNYIKVAGCQWRPERHFTSYKLTHGV